MEIKFVNQKKMHMPEFWSWLSSALVRVFPYPVCGLDEPDLVLDEELKKIV